MRTERERETRRKRKRRERAAHFYLAFLLRENIRIKWKKFI